MSQRQHLAEPLAPSPNVHEEVEVVARKAQQATAPFRAAPAETKARFLEEIARRLEELGDLLIETAADESSLPIPRLQGERGRTCGQLRMFAELVREGSWVDARIDRGDPNRKPSPKPDLRRMLVPLGPVAVFGASNFPLAFSAPGGDTASALASGCPVVVKAHPAHPKTSELAAKAIQAAATSVGLPEGVFNMVTGGIETGRALVQNDGIEAVAFTGSQAGGRALFDLAAARPRPIPVFAEMGSVNPVFVLPSCLKEQFESFVAGYAQSLVLGVGQFCTNPGILVGSGSTFDSAVKAIGAKLSLIGEGKMLTADIAKRYAQGCKTRANHPALDSVFVGDDSGSPSLFSTSAREFVASPELAEELFGPSAIAVRCESEEDLIFVANHLQGQLTATIFFTDSDDRLASALLPLLTAKAGRVIANGFPTGVEVSAAMQHGGPYPATTDSRSTSVGTAAILRFARPVAFQDIPQQLLPEELLDGNPRGVMRLIDGKPTREAI